MKLNINRKLLPVKAHYFFFMASVGPILPQVNVLGRQLGISPSVMGILLSILPVLYFFAKPLVGLLADYFSKARKAIFMMIIATMSISFGCYMFLPQQSNRLSFNVTEVQPCDHLVNLNETCVHLHYVSCPNPSETKDFKVIAIEGQSVLCHSHDFLDEIRFENATTLDCRTSKDAEADICFYKTGTFWAFVVLTYLGTIGFNVSNSISDAICFDVLGDDQQTKYGKQRVYGGIGFGLTSLLAGYVVDLHSNDFTPAAIIVLAFGSLDLFFLKKLKLPKLSAPESITKDVMKLLRHRKVVTFLAFATITGIFDSFIFYFMFWHLEEVAEKVGMKDRIKLIEGCVIASECIFGEFLFFMISGKIIKKLGYIHTMSFCFLCYALRLFLISIITNPWYLVAIGTLMQGCSYALCYTTIVAYAAVLAPSGTSTTVQGLVAGMDDGLGFSIGSLFGGFLYQKIGGKSSFQVMALVALATCIAHIILRPAATHEIRTTSKPNNTIDHEADLSEKKAIPSEEKKLTEDVKEST